MSGRSKTDELITSKYKKRSRMGEIFHRLKRNKGAIVGMCVLILLILTFFVSLFFISFESIATQNISERFSPPSFKHLFGTDNLGRDMFVRVIYGTRYSLVIGLGVVCIAGIFGISLGSIAGFFGGQIENIIMRVSDVMSSIPSILLGMVIMTTLGASLVNLIIAVGVTSIPGYIRITRASVLSVRNQEFIESARAIGIRSFPIIFTQVLPNGVAPIIVTTSASLGMSILSAAGLSFLGFGVQVPRPEWGTLISSGREFARSAPWLMIFPGLFIMFTVLSFNLLGDGLRDALDPKLKR